MTVVRWDPFGDDDTLQDRINRMFEETFPVKAEAAPLTACAWKPMVDIFETADGIVISADLPGVDKADISIEIKNDVLTLSGERRVNPPTADAEERYYRRERCFGTFRRSFSLKAGIAPAAIKATFKEGVLTIEIPHPKAEPPRHVQVNVD